MFRFREEKYTGQKSPEEGIIQFSAVQQGRIHNRAIVGEVFNIVCIRVSPPLPPTLSKTPPPLFWQDP